VETHCAAVRCPTILIYISEDIAHPLPVHSDRLSFRSRNPVVLVPIYIDISKVLVDKQQKGRTRTAYRTRRVGTRLSSSKASTCDVYYVLDQ
jgi:hypothetical protein